MRRIGRFFLGTRASLGIPFFLDVLSSRKTNRYMTFTIWTVPLLGVKLTRVRMRTLGRNLQNLKGSCFVIFVGDLRIVCRNRVAFILGE